MTRPRRAVLPCGTMSTHDTDETEECGPEEALVAVLDTEAQVHLGAKRPEPVKRALAATFAETTLLAEDWLADPTREWADDRQDLAAVLRDWHKRVAVGETYVCRLWPHDVVTLLGAVARHPHRSDTVDHDEAERAFYAWNSAFGQVRTMMDESKAYSYDEAQSQVRSVLDGTRAVPSMDMAKDIDTTNTRR